MKILLFDIDGTIMLSGGAGLRSMERIFREEYGIDNAFDGFHFQGKVDPAIFRAGFAKHGLVFDDTDAEIRRIIPLYESYIAREMPLSTKAVIYPGVCELIPRLAPRRDLSIGLLTGNVRGGARAKLSHWDLWRYFPYGAFGCDAEHRPDLVPIALARAGEHVGRMIEPGPDVYIIGDTERDIETAKAHGCTAVGVGTLNFTAAELAKLGADIVFDHLGDVENVMRTLGVHDE